MFSLSRDLSLKLLNVVTLPLIRGFPQKAFDANVLFLNLLSSLNAIFGIDLVKLVNSVNVENQRKPAKTVHCVDTCLSLNLLNVVLFSLQEADRCQNL